MIMSQVPKSTTWDTRWRTLQRLPGIDFRRVEDSGPVGSRVHNHIGRLLHEVLRSEPELATEAPRARVAGSLHLNLGVADHQGLPGRGAGFAHDGVQTHGVRLFERETVSAVNVCEECSHAETVANG